MDLILPLECFTMLNTISELRAHLFSLCHPTDPVNMVINNTSNNITRSHRQPVRNAVRYILLHFIYLFPLIYILF